MQCVTQKRPLKKSHALLYLGNQMEIGRWTTKCMSAIFKKTVDVISITFSTCTPKKRGFKHYGVSLWRGRWAINLRRGDSCKGRLEMTWHGNWLHLLGGRVHSCICHMQDGDHTFFCSPSNCLISYGGCPQSRKAMRDRNRAPLDLELVICI